MMDIELLKTLAYGLYSFWCMPVLAIVVCTLFVLLRPKLKDFFGSLEQYLEERVRR